MFSSILGVLYVWVRNIILGSLCAVLLIIHTTYSDIEYKCNFLLLISKINRLRCLLFLLQRIQYAKSKSDCIAKADGSFVPREKKKKQEEKSNCNYISTLSKRFIIDTLYFEPLCGHNLEVSKWAIII